MRAYAYPFLLAVAPVLALAAENVDRGVVPADLVGPLLLASGVALFGLLIGSLTTRSQDARGLVSLTAVAVFSAYGPTSLILPNWWPPQPHTRMLLILGVLLALGIMAGVWVVRTQKSLAGATDFLFVFGIILCLVYGVGFGTSAYSEQRASMGSDSVVGRTAERPSSAPDIWLVVFDAYTGPGALRSIYGLDNSPFLDSLRSLGFQVARPSRANYVQTVLSLGAMLDMDYLDAAVAKSRGPYYPRERLQNNRTTSELKAMGYEFVFARSAFPPLRSNRHADIQLPQRVIGEFTVYWVGTTLLYPIAFLTCHLRNCGDRELMVIEPVDGIEHKVDTLIALADRPGPKFVFAHFLLPHAPMRADSTCAPTDHLQLNLASRAGRGAAKRAYADQVKCTNRIALKLVSGILAHSRTSPVIMLQGDHGFGMFENDHPVELEHAQREQVMDRIEVLGAYHLPGDAPRLWPDITPVNIFRMVFSHYFDRDLEPLPDITYWSSWEDPFEFTVVHRSESETVSQEN